MLLLMRMRRFYGSRTRIEQGEVGWHRTSFAIFIKYCILSHFAFEFVTCFAIIDVFASCISIYMFVSILFHVVSPV